MSLILHLVNNEILFWLLLSARACEAVGRAGLLKLMVSLLVFLSVLVQAVVVVVFEDLFI